MPGYAINLGVRKGWLDVYVSSSIYGTRIGRLGWYSLPAVTAGSTGGSELRARLRAPPDH
jgi:hypothetical protein